MGSLQLECPLCCSETFPCHNSLKYHLLSITDNLFCPACSKRFETIPDLIMHLDMQCNENDNTLMTNSIDNEMFIDQSSLVTPVLIQVKDDSDDNNDLDDSFMTDSLLAKALLGNTTDNNEMVVQVYDKEVVENDENKETEIEPSGSEFYHCSSCGINFEYLEEHITNFHKGHMVYLDESEAVENSTNQLDYDEETDFDNMESMQATKTVDLPDMVQEEECVDKEGRIYIRKVVKIEKFWDNVTTETMVKDSADKISLITDNIAPETADISATDTANAQKTVEIYQCSKCGGKFTTMVRYYQHNCTGMPLDSSKYKKCKSCNACFVNTKFLLEHMKNHKPKKTTLNSDNELSPPFICEVCNTEFSAYKSLRLHKRMHEPIKTKTIEPPASYGMLGEKLEIKNRPREMFVCEICHKPYDKEYEQAHKRFHSKEIDFNCDICNRKFFTQENLDMHTRAHTETKKFVCSYCKKGFLTNEKLDAHILNKCQRRPYECQYCGRRFARPHEKVKHERIHTGEKPYVCQICGKAFRVSYCLTLHMRTHSGTRPYKCDHCGKRFKAHSVFNHHLLTHSEDRKYKCPFCPKTFKTGVQLAGHKNSHTKPFTCTECNRPFASLYAVRAHMETHQRQNNLKYKCWLCGASYARPFALRDHVREQHPTDYEKSIEGETIIFEAADGYSIIENVNESNSVILNENDESILIDIDAAAVHGLEIEEVEVPPEFEADLNT